MATSWNRPVREDYGKEAQRIAVLETLLRRMLSSNEMSNGWKSEIQVALKEVATRRHRS